MRRKKIHSSPGGDKKFHFLYYIFVFPFLSLYFILFSGFLSIKNKFRVLRCLQQTSKKENGFGMEGLEG